MKLKIAIAFIDKHESHTYRDIECGKKRTIWAWQEVHSWHQLFFDSNVSLLGVISFNCKQIYRLISRVSNIYIACFTAHTSTKICQRSVTKKLILQRNFAKHLIVLPLLQAQLKCFILKFTWLNIFPEFVYLQLQTNCCGSVCGAAKQLLFNALMNLSLLLLIGKWMFFLTKRPFYTDP